MKIRTLAWSELSDAARTEALARPVQGRSEALGARVREIIARVRTGRDAALRALTEELDRVSLQSLRVAPEEFRQAYEKVSPEGLAALREAISRIRIFHEKQLSPGIDLEVGPGVRCERRYLPVDRVGLYIPGGTAPLPSTVTMLGVPSQIAGCPLRVLATPPGRNGTIEPHILVAADLLGISQVYKLGGAQAIAALAYGTESVPKVDKIFGPGNSYVTEAKIQVAQDAAGAACDLPAGPSEVLVIADRAADPRFVAADLLSQAEHGEDSQVVLLTDSDSLVERVQSALADQLTRLARRTIAEGALTHSRIIRVKDLAEAMEISNTYGPEHLILQVPNARAYAAQVRNAGSVFIGPWSPESVGDYASGTNHVLPTYGYARAYGGVTVESFMKSVTFQELTIEGLQAIGPVVERLAEIEGLGAHREAVRIRLEAIASQGIPVRGGTK